jgi:hypothetical protein
MKGRQPQRDRLATLLAIGKRSMAVLPSAGMSGRALHSHARLALLMASYLPEATG